MNDIIDAPARAAPRISFVSLGCPKALVDSERILTQLRAEGYALSRQHAGADAVIVNTCGFLDSAKKESLEAIGAAMAENGRVIVTGCMGAEPEAIREAFPNVSAITASGVAARYSTSYRSGLSIRLFPPAGTKRAPPL